MTAELTPRSFGHDVLGPVIAEFYLRLWSYISFLEQLDDTAFLFCARGGLRMHLGWERFLAATALPRSVTSAPLMVSRLAAVRPSLVRTLTEDRDDLMPAAASALSYEFRRLTIAEASRALTGCGPADGTSRWEEAFSPRSFAEYLHHPDGGGTAASLIEQAELFRRHLDDASGRRRNVALVDTGLYGTTRQVLAEGVPDIAFSSPLLARTFRPGSEHHSAFGLAVEAEGYTPLRRRTVLLRYWHFVEWLFEPELPSVRSFSDEGGTVRSNLETDGWRERVAPAADTPFAGVLAYIDGLPERPGERITVDADRAWDELHRAIVWPDISHVNAMAVGERSHDFGLDGTWSARSDRGLLGALRGSSMWREGEVVVSGSRWSRPVLLALQGAYGLRRLRRAAARMADRR